MSFMKKKSFVFWLAGVSFLWAWSFSFVLSAESDSSSLLLEVANVLYLASSLVAAGACIVFFRKPRIASMAPMNLATGLLAVASFLIVWGEYTGMASLLWLGKLFGGPGQAIAWIFWTSEIARYDLEDIDASFLIWMIALSLFLAATAGAVLLPGLWAPFLRIAMLVGCSLGSWLTFRKVAESAPLETDPLQEGESFGQDVREESLSSSLGLLFVCLGMALAVCFVVTSVSQRLCTLDTGTTRLVYAAAALIVFPIAWLVLRMTRQFGPASLYRWAVPMVVVGMAMCLLMPNGPFVMASLAFALVTIGFEGMYHLLFIYAAKRYVQKRLLIASVGILTMTLGGIMGSIVLAAVPSGREALEATLLVSVVAFVVVASATPRSGSMSGLGARQGESSREDRAVDNQSEELEEVCRRFANRYHLTPREEEVLRLMMRGRSRTFIRETLFISKGTVDTHINHIYKKTDVNSKEALERLVYDRP